MSIGYDIPLSPWEENYTTKCKDLSIDMMNLIYVPTTNSQLDHLTCPICKLPFINPWSTICGHTFCKDCIFESLLGTGDKCPLDRVNLHINKQGDFIEDSDDLFQAPIILSNIADDLEVKCLNMERGCGWVGPRWEVENHIVEKCEFTRVKCWCNEYCGRGVFEEHGFLKRIEGGKYEVERDEEDKCVHSMVACGKCKIEVQMLNEKKHLEQECLENKVICEGCHLQFPYMYLESHEKKCQKLYVECPGLKFGCVWKGQRELLDSVHAKDCMFIKLSRYLDKVEGRVHGLERENEKLKNQINALIDSVVKDVSTSNSFTNLPEISSNGSSTPSTARDVVHQVSTLERIADDFIFNPNINTKVTLKIKMMLDDLEMNKNVTKSLIEENVGLHDQLNNQRAMISSLQQQLQFLMIERRRWHGVPGNEKKLPTKL